LRKNTSAAKCLCHSRQKNFILKHTARVPGIPKGNLPENSIDLIEKRKKKVENPILQLYISQPCQQLGGEREKKNLNPLGSFSPEAASLFLLISTKHSFWKKLKIFSFNFICHNLLSSVRRDKKI
jgi:hypothetical protein